MAGGVIERLFYPLLAQLLGDLGERSPLSRARPQKPGRKGALRRAKENALEASRDLASHRAVSVSHVPHRNEARAARALKTLSRRGSTFSHKSNPW
ncbi:MAG TPA: hypothetical protein DEP35_18115 [Deltaproteobacteria bacterium]|nr:hypothetical protein [Deltaproteobacteria bacterium]